MSVEDESGDDADDEAVPQDREQDPPEQAETPEVTPQSRDLRRQQYMVGVGASILTGFALAVGSLQQFPELPGPVALAAGIVGASVVYWLVKRSLFPTDEELG
ncbi:hypothetical protein [Halovenus salina]|uniref:Uncharacterized protein n=1 Tax=Halovenus salina TaxID=1510225 RepID=A0ABD5VW84_9EURY|nr:hypothetical protein [Halovenus salina]